MNELLVFCFNDEYEADEVRTTLLKMRRDHLVDLEDAIVAMRNKEGKIKLRLIHHFSDRGALGGGVLGLLAGSIFLTPIFEYVVHEAGSTVGEEVLAKAGVSRDFIKKLAPMLGHRTSALFILVLNADPDKVLEDLKRFRGKLLRATLLKDVEEIKADLGAIK